MRKKKLFGYCKMPLNLQHFAEDGDGAGADVGDGGGSGTDGGTDGAGTGGAGDKPNTFDEVLANKEYQSEFDRRVQKAVNTAVTNAQQKWQALTDDKLSEADKLAKMTKEEKSQYLTQKKEKELSDKEAMITRRELMAEAKNTLAEKKLPAGLADILNFSDAESCSKSIAAVEKAFQEAVEAGVQEKLKGGEPPKKAPSVSQELQKQIEQSMGLIQERKVI